LLLAGGVACQTCLLAGTGESTVLALSCLLTDSHGHTKTPTQTNHDAEERRANISYSNETLNVVITYIAIIFFSIVTLISVAIAIAPCSNLMLGVTNYTYCHHFLVLQHNPCCHTRYA
jgi:hypothetical protein